MMVAISNVTCGTLFWKGSNSSALVGELQSQLLLKNGDNFKPTL